VVSSTALGSIRHVAIPLVETIKVAAHGHHTAESTVDGGNSVQVIIIVVVVFIFGLWAKARET